MAEQALEKPEFDDFEPEELIRFRGYDNWLRAYYGCLAVDEILVPALYKEIASRIRLPALNPAEINSLFEGTKPFSGHKNFAANTGMFFAALMQDSYEKGNNPFFLNAEYVKQKAGYIGYGLRGKKESPLKLMIKGNAGICLADEAENVAAKAASCGDWAGKFSRGTRLFVTKAGAYALWRASDSLLVADFVGISPGNGARNCEFRTREKETLERMLESVPLGRRNKIILIGENGSYKVVRAE